ncbi:MAG: ABC transporter ATP-binding protein [Planctomycetota bacterium]|nr:MAG: ABC transporter ATP-binding protein [Planctomycetota bacterium]
MRLLLGFARAYPGRSALTLLAIILAGLTEGLSLGTVLPLLGSMGGEEKSWLSEKLVALLASMGITPSMGALITIILGGLVLKSVLMLLASRQVSYTVAHVATDLRLSLLRALLSSRWEYYVHRPIGVLANAVGTEAMRSSMAYKHGATVVAQAFQAAVAAVIALMISWQATLTALAAGLVVLATLNGLVRMARKAGTEQTVYLKSLVARLTDTLQSVKPIRSMGREGFADSLLVEDTQDLSAALQRKIFSKEALRSLQEPLITGILLFGIFAAIQLWHLPLVEITVLVLLLSKIMSKMGRVQRQYQNLVACESAYWSFQNELRSAEREREPELGTKTPTFQHEIRLDDVSFSYAGQSVFRNVSLTVPAGQWTSIVGASGQGKTTLVDLVTGLLRPQRGEVVVDGTKLSELDVHAWRRMLGYVPQETMLLHDSILTNVTLGDPALGAEDVERALRAAGAWEFVAELPDRMLWSVGERGARLSGGQRQRIAIARALVHRPKLLILDEATSGLDPAMEAEICTTLAGLCGELTILAISHQTGLVDQADVVYRLEHGGVSLMRGSSPQPSEVPEPS